MFTSHATPMRVLAILTCSVCLVVVVLGAYVRLNDAGLGCPDWPGCYGHLTPAAAAADMHGAGTAATIAQQSGRPLEMGKAWREMVHRYVAGSLVLLIGVFALCAWSWRRERLVPLRPALVLPGLVLVQALFGMLTVTWRLKPVIVSTHLLLGLTTLSLLWWLTLRVLRRPANARRTGTLPEIDLPGPQLRLARGLAAVALGVLVMQVALGGWTSSNYAALACPDVPTCQGRWAPAADFHAGFALGRDISINTGRGFSAPALIAIQLAHRYGAAVVTLMLLIASLAAFRARPSRGAVWAGAWILVALAVQLTIGVTMVLFAFPLELATAHNAGAALLLCATLALNQVLYPVSI